MLVNQKFSLLALFLQIAMIFLFGFCVSYSDILEAKNDLAGLEGPGTRYAFYQDVHVMMFIGFGYLMTFLKKYTYGAVGFNFMVAAFAIQWTILCTGFWHCVHTGDWSRIETDEVYLINADFGAAAVLITFGGVLGKVNSFQLLTIAVIEIFFYTLNVMIAIEEFGAADIGGSMVIHTFGAYFGLACALVIGTPEVKDNSNNSVSKTSDTFAMIGTVFLWMFWPSFNAAIASPGSHQHRIVINTVLCLASCCLTTFLWSPLLRYESKFYMVDIQNASIAGGVAMGASADMMLNPWAAILIGCAASFLSVFGYTRVQHFLEKKIKLYDTCGIHNLHGMPGILGALISVIASAAASEGVYGSGLGVVFPRRAPSDPARAALDGVDPGIGRSASSQAEIQLATLGVTLLIAIPTGALTGYIIKRPFFEPPTQLFSDSIYWEIPTEDDEAVVDL